MSLSPDSNIWQAHEGISARPFCIWLLFRRYMRNCGRVCRLELEWCFSFAERVKDKRRGVNSFFVLSLNFSLQVPAAAQIKTNLFQLYPPLLWAIPTYFAPHEIYERNFPLYFSRALAYYGRVEYLGRLSSILAWPRFQICISWMNS